MLNKNIKTLRKTKGLSLQELVVKLDVVRQTISKWDQELSVPDSDMLISIAEALETPVSTLLGETITEDLLRHEDQLTRTFLKFLLRLFIYRR